MTPPLSHHGCSSVETRAGQAQAGRELRPGRARARHFTVYPRPSMQTPNAF